MLTLFIATHKVPKPHLGLCAHTNFHPELFKAWPKFSGSSDFPINDEASLLSPSQQYRILPHYEGNQLTLRLDLASFMLDHLNAPYTLEELSCGLR